MDKELIDMIVRLKVESKILRGLIDVIFEGSRLTYDEKELIVGNDSQLFAVIKAFFGDEYDNRLKELKDLKAKNETEEA